MQSVFSMWYYALLKLVHFSYKIYSFFGCLLSRDFCALKRPCLAGFIWSRKRLVIGCYLVLGKGAAVFATFGPTFERQNAVYSPDSVAKIWAPSMSSKINALMSYQHIQIRSFHTGSCWAVLCFKNNVCKCIRKMIKFCSWNVPILEAWYYIKNTDCIEVARVDVL